jgi:TPR repeat protein
LKGQDLAPKDLVEQAERAAQGGDCEAAIRIYIEAARRDATLALQLGGRYDPSGFRPSPCFAEPKPDSALVWYLQAAEAGIPKAQRRYGELLLGEANSGPVYQDAVAWLRKASAAGDAAAADRLMALGER